MFPYSEVNIKTWNVHDLRDTLRQHEVGRAAQRYAQREPRTLTRLWGILQQGQPPPTEEADETAGRTPAVVQPWQPEGWTVSMNIKYFRDVWGEPDYIQDTLEEWRGVIELYTRCWGGMCKVLYIYVDTPTRIAPLLEAVCAVPMGSVRMVRVQSGTVGVQNVLRAVHRCEQKGVKLDLCYTHIEVGHGQQHLQAQQEERGRLLGVDWITPTGEVYTPPHTYTQ